MSQLDANTTNLQSILDAINALPEAGIGGGGGSVETCTVTITQEWGMNDDPDFLHLYVPYYNVQSDGSIQTGYEYFTSANDYEAQHSVTFTAYKNIPINILMQSAMNVSKVTTSATGGTLIVHDTNLSSQKIYSLTSTADTAIFTFSSP